MDPKDELKKIKTGSFSRALAIAKVAAGAGARAAGVAAKKAFLSTEKGRELNDKFLELQMKLLSQELGRLKGSLMKAGQVFSMVGEHLLPPQANEFLKTLHNRTPPLAWPAIEEVLIRELGPEKVQLLEIETKSFASASLGQVHLAALKSNPSKKIALKIQYPGVEAAIDSDLNSLRKLLTISKILPEGLNLQSIFEEVRTLLHQEVDYEREREWTILFKEALADDLRYIVPSVYSDFSTGRILATSFEEGVSIDDSSVLAISQDRRNRLALNFMELYYKEIFVWGAVQTDPHYGNYRVQLDAKGNDRLVLLDFGAVRKFEAEFLDKYRALVRTILNRDPAGVKAAVGDIGYWREGDTQEAFDLFYCICDLIMEPYREEAHTNGAYDWGRSDLLKRISEKKGEVLRVFGIRPPRREFLFVDRKVMGIFVALSKLGAKIDASEMLKTYLARPLTGF